MTTARERAIARIRAIIKDTESCVNADVTDCDGYGQYQLRDNGKKIRFRLHRLSYEVYNGIIPEGMVVRHTCDNPPCINPKHLLVGTNADNVRDRVSRGRSAVGKNHPRYTNGHTAKFDHVPKIKAPWEDLCFRSLTWEQAKEIKDKIKNRTGSLKKLSVELGVKETVLRDMSSGRTYKEV